MNRSSSARGGDTIFSPTIVHSDPLSPPSPFPLSYRRSTAPFSPLYCGGLASSSLPSTIPRQPRYPLHPVVSGYRRLPSRWQRGMDERCVKAVHASRGTVRDRQKEIGS